MHTVHRLAAALATSTGLVAAAQTPAQKTFTYQGYLEEAGAPVNGLFDLNIALYPAPVDGVQLAVQVFDDVTITDGVFSVEIDASAPGLFAGDQRWARIGIRPGLSGVLDPFTFFEPRQKIAAAPYAVRSITQGFTKDNPADPLIEAGDGNDRALINRDVTITSNEYFGFTTPTGDFTYGGMYANTLSPLGLPFYGFAAGNNPLGWTEFDPTTNSWNLRSAANGSPFLTMNFSTGALTAPDFTYRTPRTQHLTIPAAALVPTNGADGYTYDIANDWISGATGTNQRFIAPVNLPDGAVITSFTVHAQDLSATRNVIVYLRRIEKSDLSKDSLQATATSGNSGVQTVTEPVGGLLGTVNNNLFYYRLVVIPSLAANNADSSWDGSSIQFIGATIEYQTAGPR